MMKGLVSIKLNMYYLIFQSQNEFANASSLLFLSLPGERRHPAVHSFNRKCNQSKHINKYLCVVNNSKGKNIRTIKLTVEYQEIFLKLSVVYKYYAIPYSLKT